VEVFYAFEKMRLCCGVGGGGEGDAAKSLGRERTRDDECDRECKKCYS
jgi:hypothetical protein